MSQRSHKSSSDNVLHCCADSVAFNLSECVLFSCPFSLLSFSWAFLPREESYSNVNGLYYLA